MTVLAARRRLTLPFLTAILLALGLLVVPSSPASAAVTQGISGHVTGPSGEDLAGIDVFFLQELSDGGLEPYGPVVTDAGGHYAATLPAGSYLVAFYDEGGTYITEYWDDTTSFADATAVPVTASSVAGGIDAQLAAGGHVTGTVAGSSSGWVEAWTESSPGAGDWEPSYGADLQSDGTYDIGGLPTGDYRLSFHADGFEPEFWKDVADVDSATTIHVTAPGSSGPYDPTLTPDAHVQGHVEDTTGAPLQGVHVTAWEYDGTEWFPADAPDAVTDAAGDYDLTIPHGTYRIGFSAFGGDVTEFYDDKATVEEATSITLDTSATVTDKDAVLDVGATISGTVTLPDSVDPYSNDGVVTVIDQDTKDTVRETWLQDETAPGSGTYTWSVGGLPAGDYAVEFAGEDGWATAEAQFFDGKPESAGPAKATVVSLTAGQQRTGVDATLREGGTISGTLLDGHGDPLAGCDVVAFNKITHYASRVGTTGSDGSFVVGGLTTGQYGLLVGRVYDPSSPCATTEYYTNTDGDLSEDPTGIVAVDTAPGTDDTLPSDLVYGGSVATPAIANVTAPSVPTAAPVVGTPVTADPGTWNPADVTVSYQWLASGSVISGATGKSYTPVAADIGKSLSVVVRARKTGYSDATQASNGTAAVVTAPSQTATIANGAPPGITGIPRVGLELTAYAGSWSTPDGAPATALQWLRNGVPIVGATGSTYELGADDLGGQISLRVTASKDGYQPSQLVSAPTATVTAGIITLTDVPRLLGRLKVGRVLVAVPPMSTPAATTVRYQWLRNGVAIKGIRAKQARYSLVRADRHRRISVRITVLRPGYEPTVSVARKAGRVR